MQIIVGALIGIALFLILEDHYKIPLNGTFKSIAGMSRQINTDSKINSTLEELANWLSSVIRISEYKRIQLEADLRTARMDISPEMFVSNCIVKAGVYVFLGAIMLPASTVMGVAVIGVGAVVYFNEKRSLPGRIKAKRENIEYELSNFVFTIEKTLRHSRDLIDMFDSYIEIAGPELKHELTVTLADMRSGNTETAIARMETRVGSPMMSDVCRGLISILRGDDTTVYWQSLELKLEDYQRETLKAEANKIPKRVNKLSMTMLIFFMLTWIVVIAVQVVESMVTLFA